MNETLNYIKNKLNLQPEIGLILGSGLGVLADEIENPIKIPYGDIPNFPVSTVKGHKGQLVIGKLNGVSVLAMQGRFHYYEGYSLKQVTFPIRIMQALNIQKLVVTNAAGGINKSFAEGAIMLIQDHINLTGNNPLIGKNNDLFGERFPDMSYAYDQNFLEIAKKISRKINIQVEEGIYAGLTGPSYETPAEIRFLRTIGADAVGMSTVPEVIVANHAKMKVLGISCITNMAAGVLKGKLDHKKVVETADRVQEDLKNLVLNTIAEL